MIINNLQKIQDSVVELVGNFLGQHMPSSGHQPQLGAEDMLGDVAGMLRGGVFILFSLDHQGGAANAGKERTHIPFQSGGCMPAMVPVIKGGTVLLPVDTRHPLAEFFVSLECLADAFDAGLHFGFQVDMGGDGDQGRDPLWVGGCEVERNGTTVAVPDEGDRGQLKGPQQEVEIGQVVLETWYSQVRANLGATVAPTIIDEQAVARPGKGWDLPPPGQGRSQAMVEKNQRRPIGRSMGLNMELAVVDPHDVNGLYTGGMPIFV